MISSSFSLYSVPGGSPESVAFTKRKKKQLTVSWRDPDKKLQNGELTGYKVCYSDKANNPNNPNCSVCYIDKARSSNPSCLIGKDNQPHTIVIKKLRPATKYFVTVAAGTIAGYGINSSEISNITNGGKTLIRLNL